ncbi:hypothetical protein LTR37_012163 [Vermiconidia calcicola]|uniref:Uncharacterized protein n=1 Tax=Vermiconidia calcicola TaxID=1690605 RepID=A0ACC3N0A6_9PEZI|nr:hypothetical protein LTR37_012163 [Vermiconidia calcicola]
MAHATECAKQFQDGVLITVQLEGTDAKFFVQKALLCSVSDYFKKALQPTFKEGKEETLRLPVCNEATFEVFLYWLCHRALPEELENEDYNPGPQRGEGDQVLRHVSHNQRRLVRLWCLADSYLMPKLQNDCMKSLLINFDRNYVGVEVVRLAAEVAASESMISNVVMSQLAASYHALVYDRHECDYLGATPGVLLDLVARLRRCLPGKGCEYAPEAPSDNDYSEYMV